jgi:hypothetical protein
MPRVVRFVHRRSELLVDLVLPSLACLVSASTHQIPEPTVMPLCGAQSAAQPRCTPPTKPGNTLSRAERPWSTTSATNKTTYSRRNSADGLTVVEDAP